MNDNDGLAAETRRLLDAATQGPWEACTAPHPDDDKTPAEWLASCMTGEGELWCVTAPNTTDDGYGYLVPAVTGDGPFSEAHAELIAAAPRLLANWLARNEQTEAVEDDLGRIANENAALAGRLMAERDRLADENRALREAIRTHEDLHRPVGPDSPNGPIHMDGWPCCDDDRHLWAAADRGVTDGDRNEGDER